MQISQPSSHSMSGSHQPGHCSEVRQTPTLMFPLTCRLHGSEKGQFKADGWALGTFLCSGQDALSGRKGHLQSQQKSVTEWGALSGGGGGGRGRAGGGDLLPLGLGNLSATS